MIYRTKSGAAFIPWLADHAQALNLECGRRVVELWVKGVTKRS